MSGRIPQSFIDDLVSRADIVDIVNARVTLRKAGREFSACCPFHNEKTPSFTVSREKQFYHCFGCGAHGTAIGFLMDYNHMTFVDAIEELASNLGLEIPYENAHDPNKASNESLYELLKQVSNNYQEQLRSHSNAARAVEYLKNRGLSGKTAKEFLIGYAPPGWDHLRQKLGQGDHKQKQLTLSGMLIENEDGKRYDRFRNRIMFPIRDRRGRTIGFGGRALGDDDKPKYLNSPETPLFHKGKELYGLYEAQQALRKITRLLVVEGYMDVTSLAEYDIRYAVATLGTATTQEHLSLLFRTTDKIIFCFDGDRAGREAAWKALQVALPTIREGKQINFMFLPDGEDPDSLVQKEGREQFEGRINQAQPLSEFIFDRLSQDVDTSTIDGRARLTEMTRNLLSQLPGGVFKHMLTERLAEIVEVDSKQLAAFIAPHERPKRPKLNRKNKSQLTPVSFMIAMLLQQPRLSVFAHGFEAGLDTEIPGLPLLTEILELLRKNPNLQTGALLEHWRDQEAGRHLFKLAQWQFPLAEEHMESEFQGALKQLKTKLSEQKTEQLLKKERETGLDATEKVQLRHLLTRGTSTDNGNLMQPK